MKNIKESREQNKKIQDKANESVLQKYTLEQMGKAYDKIYHKERNY